MAGVNHFIWITDVSVHGRGVTEESFRRIMFEELFEAQSTYLHQF